MKIWKQNLKRCDLGRGWWHNLKNVDLAVTWSVPAGTVWSSNAVTEQKREGIGAGGVGGVVGIMWAHKYFQMHKIEIATGWWRQLQEGYKFVFRRQRRTSWELDCLLVGVRVIQIVNCSIGPNLLNFYGGQSSSLNTLWWNLLIEELFRRYG